MFHKFPCFQHLKCFKKSNTLNEIEQSTILEVPDEVEWNQRQEIIFEFSFQISQTNLTYISNWQRCQLICIFRNKLKKHVNQKQEFNQNLDIVKKLYFFIIIYICINLNLTLCKLSSAIMRDLIFQVHVLRKAKVIHIVSKGYKKCIHKR